MYMFCGLIVLTDKVGALKSIPEFKEDLMLKYVNWDSVFGTYVIVMGVSNHSGSIKMEISVHHGYIKNLV